MVVALLLSACEPEAILWGCACDAVYASPRYYTYEYEVFPTLVCVAFDDEPDPGAAVDHCREEIRALGRQYISCDCTCEADEDATCEDPGTLNTGAVPAD